MNKVYKQEIPELEKLCYKCAVPEYKEIQNKRTVDALKGCAYAIVFIFVAFCLLALLLSGST